MDFFNALLGGYRDHRDNCRSSLLRAVNLQMRRHFPGKQVTGIRNNFEAAQRVAFFFYKIIVE